MNKRKGISLIVLVITILVMIILAGVVVVSLQKNNPIQKAKEAKFKSDVSSFASELEIGLSNKISEDTTFKKEDADANTFNNIKEYINSFTKSYENKLVIVDGELVYSGRNLQEKKWAEEIGIIGDLETALLPKPKLVNSLTPIKWDLNNNEIETTSSDKDWYSYNNNEWANAKSKDGSYWVWIPRFAYRIIYYANNEDRDAALKYTQGDAKREEKAIGYSDIRGIVDKDGNLNNNFSRISYIIEVEMLGEGNNKNSYIENQKYKYDVTQPKGNENPKGYVIHPAFTNFRRKTFVKNSNENYGWDKDISGFWVSKFFMVNDITSNKFRSVPGIEKNRILTITETNIEGKKLKETLFENNKLIDSMNCKITQYGALHMFSLGKVGENYIQNDTMFTGDGPGEEYKNNIKKTSTSNITGVYDLNVNFIGWYMLNSFIPNNNFLNTYGKELSKEMNTKYFDVYKVSQEDTLETNYNINSDKYGDYMYEITNFGIKYENFIYFDFPYRDQPFFSRNNLNIGNITGDAIRDVWRGILVVE